MQFKAKPLSRDTINSIAMVIRKSVKADSSLYFPIVEYIEWGLSGCEGFNYMIVPKKEMGDTYGTTNTTQNIMRIREDVYQGAVNGNPRDRFTMCHELGHYFLHRPELIEFARGDIPIYCQPEWQANTFAAELLAPRQLIDGMSIEEISKQCGISYTAASIQYKQIKKR